ncbi:hypothetical protein Q73A0000_05680 [Kaistella flava (ex Peng et al. 2021)]|uniref:Uncharacterized protein n=1 Tax=Kaistella flava (ex Peng et al. 2021) TaxID=2038776 RepID=A0A7M2Y6L3_9FLAO|nr:hypothetical protein [Kaistella flava (ex Peng et al. 2021)]QOW09888.1 hypothetical protein Q73A0000_05680 [Kaistella flava (ex Peng et al. 2021)]
MRNWHHKVIKLIPVFLFVLGFGQRSQKHYDSICSIAYKDDSILYLKLRKEARHVNYKKLTEKIINDIQWDSLKKANLIFYITSIKREFNPMDYHPMKTCEFDQKSKNPNYNDTIFWNKKNIEFIVKKYKKNLIPKIATSFIYDKTNTFFVIGLNHFIEHTRKQKEGIFKDSRSHQEKFHYFAYEKQEKLVLDNEEENYNQLFLSFTNELGNIVNVEYAYGDGALLKQYRVEKKYQYVNKKWIEIKDDE